MLTLTNIILNILSHSSKTENKIPKKSLMHTLELDFNGLVEKSESMLKKATLEVIFSLGKFSSMMWVSINNLKKIVLRNI